MGDKFLVRAYNVGVGDCIYVRIPEGDDGFHILIDCGTIGRIDLLKRAIKNLEEKMLPDADHGGKKRLDLLVATHRHRDHIKGFDPTFFKNIQIKNVWLSVAMDKDHTQAEKAIALHDLATKAMREIDSRGLSLSPPLQTLVSLYSLDNDNAMKALRELLPREATTYVHAGLSQEQLGMSLENATIRVLAPENDIDGYYLGEDADETLMGFHDSGVHFKRRSKSVETLLPKNISEADFDLLRSRVLSNALAFAEDDSSIQNNTSVVLLIEWRGRRLLFSGDAEWEGEYKEDKHNGSWNVMWHERSNHLNKSLDFLKIGHHGSRNATPWWEEKGSDYEVNMILNAILPIPEGGAKPVAQAVASTQRTAVYKPIPASDLMVELGGRVRNTRNYYDELEKLDQEFDKKKPFDEYWEYELPDNLKKHQPWRTDMEKILTGKDWIDVEIGPGDE